MCCVYNYSVEVEEDNWKTMCCVYIEKQANYNSITKNF